MKVTKTKILEENPAAKAKRKKSEEEVDERRKHKEGTVEHWSCITVKYPIAKIIVGFAAYDFVRAIFDTIVLLVLVVHVSGITYEQVYSNKERDTILAKEQESYFDHTKSILMIIMTIFNILVFLDTGLAALLFISIKKSLTGKMSLWIHLTMFYVFLNFLSFIGLLVYTSRANLIYDEAKVWKLDGDEVDKRALIYINILRCIMFDLIKGAEIIIVQSFKDETKLRKKAQALREIVKKTGRR